jgi:hypothetical protein
MASPPLQRRRIGPEGSSMSGNELHAVIRQMLPTSAQPSGVRLGRRAADLADANGSE